MAFRNKSPFPCSQFIRFGRTPLPLKGDVSYEQLFNIKQHTSKHDFQYSYEIHACVRPCLRSFFFNLKNFSYILTSSLFVHRKCESCSDDISPRIQNILLEFKNMLETTNADIAVLKEDNANIKTEKRWTQRIVQSFRLRKG